MTSTAIETVVKMLESVPEKVQGQLVDHLRQYIDDLRDEMKWDASFKKTASKLELAARKAKKQTAEGHARPMDFHKL